MRTQYIFTEIGGAPSECNSDDVTNLLEWIRSIARTEYPTVVEVGNYQRNPEWAAEEQHAFWLYPEGRHPDDDSTEGVREIVARVIDS